jgi:hypothetical protein
MFTNQTRNVPMTPPVEQPGGLSHTESIFCWCEPIVETDEDGEEAIVHREITWN